jgi:ABC-type Mn2+/Zn2+ transport system ATPase subunit
MTVYRPSPRVAIRSIDPLVRLDHVSYGYEPDQLAVENVDLVLRQGDFVGVVGPSGSGKSTLLKLLLGTARPTSGSVTRQDGLRIGYVPQVETINWNFPVTVFETVIMASRNGRRTPWTTKAERAGVHDVLHRLGIGDLEHRHIRQLSGGQQQRVFIARALFSSPAVLLLDEPTSGVDIRTRHEVLHLLADLSDDGLAVALTTHDLNGIAAHLPELICLNRTIIGRGSPADVMTSEVLEQTYGAPMEVLQHAGMPLVIEGRGRPHAGGLA